ncbi:MAG: HpaII family restriction endonuclease [Ignavibacteria bacterium]|nr:HpaII family restriction endonuclease [Ignavibacteria bacterium]
MLVTDVILRNKDFVIQKPLLLKSSLKTNFIYKVISKDNFEFVKIEFENFYWNLILCDTGLPQILSELLKKFYLLNESKLSTLTEIVAEENLLNFDFRHKQNVYNIR